MIDEQILQRAVGRIIETVHPSRVILFGSQGRGDADEGSDVDLMVVKPRVDNRREEMAELYQLVGPTGAGVDVLLYSEAEYERRSQVPGTVLYWACKEGKTLYEAPS